MGFIAAENTFWPDALAAVSEAVKTCISKLRARSAYTVPLGAIEVGLVIAKRVVQSGPGFFASPILQLCIGFTRGDRHVWNASAMDGENTILATTGKKER